MGVRSHEFIFEVHVRSKTGDPIKIIVLRSFAMEPPLKKARVGLVDPAEREAEAESSEVNSTEAKEDEEEVEVVSVENVDEENQMEDETVEEDENGGKVEEEKKPTLPCNFCTFVSSAKRGHNRNTALKRHMKVFHPENLEGTVDEISSISLEGEHCSDATPDEEENRSILTKINDLNNLIDEEGGEEETEKENVSKDESPAAGVDSGDDGDHGHAGKEEGDHAGEEGVDQVDEEGIKQETNRNDKKRSELTRNEDEKCSLADLKETKKVKVNEDKIRNSWMTDNAQIAFGKQKMILKRKYNAFVEETKKEKMILKREYHAFVEDYAKTSNQILKVVANQKKKITDLKMRNDKQKLEIDLLKKREKEVIGECKLEATDNKDGILAAIKEEPLKGKTKAPSFSKVGDAFKDKEVLMSTGKEELISLFNAELRDIEKGLNYLNDVIREKEVEISKKDEALCQETKQRLRLEAQALLAKDAFKEALEAQIDEIEQLKKESRTAAPKMVVLINQLTVEVGNAKAALLAKDRERKKMEEEHKAVVRKSSKDSVDIKKAFEACKKRQDDQIDKLEKNIFELEEKLETANNTRKCEKEELKAKESELQQIKKDLQNNVSHKENFFKEALEAKSVVISQLTARGENARRESLEIKSKNVELENRNLRQREELQKIENEKNSILNMRDSLEKERALQKEEIQRLQLKENSSQEFVQKLQSENIEKDNQIALLGLQREQIVAEMTTAVEKERGQNNSSQDVIFELEACNKRQDDQIDKLEKNISELKINLEAVNKTWKSEREELAKQNDLLKECNVRLKMKLIKQNDLQKEEKKSTERSFNQTVADIKKKYQRNHLKMSTQKDGQQIDILETETSRNKVKSFISQIESTEKVGEIDKLFSSMFNSLPQVLSSSEQEAAPVACSSTNTFSSEDKNEKKSTQKYNSKLQPPPHTLAAAEVGEIAVRGEEMLEVLEEGELPNEEVVPAARCPLCKLDFPTISKLEVHASGCMQENNVYLKSCFVFLRNINGSKSRERRSASPRARPDDFISLE